MQSFSKTTQDALGFYVYGLSIYDGVVARVYFILQWFRAGETFSSRTSKDPQNRWEFVGNEIKDHPLKGKKLVKADGSKLVDYQNGYGYIN